MERYGSKSLLRNLIPQCEGERIHSRSRERFSFVVNVIRFFFGPFRALIKASALAHQATQDAKLYSWERRAARIIESLSL
jgi:hypothetical protein